MNRKLQYVSKKSSVAALSLLLYAASAWALEPETIAAIASAVQIGTAVSQGEIKPELAAEVVKGLRNSGVKNDGIRDLFKSMVDETVAHKSRNDTGMTSHGNGMGAFVQAAHARGLRGRALAEAIHEEQARRGISGQIGKHDDDDEHERVGKLDNEDEHQRGRSGEHARGPFKRHHNSRGGRR